MNKKFFSKSLITVLCFSMLAFMSGCGEEKPYDYDLSEYITVGEYKGLEYTIEEVSVTDEEIQAEIDARLNQAATTEEVKEGVVEEGDTINVAYKGTIDGEEFEGGSTDSSDLVIGQSQMIDGFIEGLTGEDIGSTVTLDLQFPDDYHVEDLAGKPVQFVVDINCKKVQKLPEYNDEFVKANSDSENTEEFEKSIEEEILENKQNQADSQAKAELWEQIVSASEVKKYPEKEVNEFKDTMKENMKQNVSQQGMEWEDYLEQAGTTEEEFDENLQSYAEEKVKQDMIVYYIAREEKLDVSNKEYKDRMNDLLEEAGFTKDTFKDNFGMSIEEYCEQNELRTSMILNKVIDKVMEYGTEV